MRDKKMLEVLEQAKARDIDFSVLSGTGILSGFAQVAELKGTEIGIIYLLGQKNDKNKQTIELLVKTARKLKKIEGMDGQTINYIVTHLPAILSE